MNWIEQTVADFGRNLGFPGLRLNAAGSVQFTLEAGGVLGIDVLAEEAVIFLGRGVAPHDHATPVRALRLVHWRHRRPFAVQVAQGNGLLLFAARLPLRQVALPVLEQALDLLTRLHDQARG